MRGKYERKKKRCRTESEYVRCAGEWPNAIVNWVEKITAARRAYGAIYKQNCLKLQSQE